MRRPACASDLRVTVCATHEAVEGVCAEFRAGRETFPDPANYFVSELLLREALANALLHGCRGDPDRTIHCQVRVNPHRLIVAVRDDGAGFDWRTALGRQAPVSAVCGRGLEIFRTYGTRVRFNSRGNAVIVIKRF